MDRFVQKIKNTYLPYKLLEGDALKEAIFATKPGNGACGESIFPFCSAWMSKIMLSVVFKVED